jgi:hypothetical protein
MEAYHEVLARFDRLIVVTIWKVVLETITLLLVMLLLYHLLSRG